MSRTVAILGASGLVGRTMLAILEQRAFPCDRVRLLASPRQGGRTLPFRGAEVPVEPVSADAFTGVELALFAVKNPLAQQWAPVARAAGACVIDNSSAYRYDDAVPLVVPEVNGALLDARPTLVANPNCSAAPLVLALQPLRALGELRKLVVATYQSVSGAGSGALDELESGLHAAAGGAAPPRLADGRPPFALNCIPHIDVFLENGYTKEEMKVVQETHKILDPAIRVTCTAVRVPVTGGHSESVNVEFAKDFDLEEVRQLLRATPGIVLADDPANDVYPMPLLANGRDEVFVGRLRRDESHPRALNLWIVADNLRKGAATNAVQIAELLVANKLKTAERAVQ